MKSRPQILLFKLCIFVLLILNVNIYDVFFLRHLDRTRLKKETTRVDEKKEKNKRRGSCGLVAEGKAEKQRTEEGKKKRKEKGGDGGWDE